VAAPVAPVSDRSAAGALLVLVMASMIPEAVKNAGTSPASARWWN
jgi:hypothetical protein